jgi:hypothetical protein
MRKDIFSCIDCEVDTRSEYYMVHDWVWELSGMNPYDGMLCIGCLEKRLGRKLIKGDFPNIPINWISPCFDKSERFIKRLTQ